MTDVMVPVEGSKSIVGPDVVATVSLDYGMNNI